jgi:serine/threonine protein kinase
LTESTLKTLGRYQIQGEIGRGTMGVVYKALDPALGRTVALKTVHLAFSVAEADREVYEQRFMTEAKVAAALSHPGIVVVHDVGRDPESHTLYIALEYLRGDTLETLVSNGRQLDWHEALRLTGAVAEALDHAHSHGVVHRDVKPANIMVLPSGEPKIMDFGIAKVPTSELTGAGEFFGTPSYMSPEQAQGETVDKRSDIFSLGSVMYLLLTGARPFDGPNVPAIVLRVAHKDPAPPSSLAPQLPAAVDAVVARALAKDPASRYPDCRSLAEDIEDLRAGRPPGHLQGWIAPPPHEATLVASGPWGKPAAEMPVAPQTSQVSTTARRGNGKWAAIVVVGLLAAVASIWLLRRPTPVRTGEAQPLSTSPAERAPDARESSEPSPGSALALPSAKESARLEVLFEHSLRSGNLKVWVDDDLVIDEALESRTVRKFLTVRIRKGSLLRTVAVAPGEHVVKVQVQAEGEIAARQIRGSFESGAKRRLEVNRGGLPLIKKDLSIEWS